MTDVKLDAGRLVVLEANRHRANKRAIEAGHEARDAVQRLREAEAEAASAEGAYRQRFGEFPRKGSNIEGEPQARRHVEAARQRCDALRTKAQTAREAAERASDAFQDAARVHETAVAYAKRHGVQIPPSPDRGDSLAYAPATLVNARP